MILSSIGLVEQKLNLLSKQEEFSCRDGSCIAKDYVCDGVDDCNSGEDETGCRSITSLFAKEEGFRLQGRVGGKWLKHQGGITEDILKFLSRIDKPNTRGDI